VRDQLSRAPFLRLIHHRAIFLLMEKDALRRAIKIIILAVSHRPKKCDERDGRHGQRDRNEPDQRRQRTASAARGEAVFGSLLAAIRSLIGGNLSALATTRMDDMDIATAAISGVTYPARATGITKRL
jgi:hypothetical protein